MEQGLDFFLRMGHIICVARHINQRKKRRMPNTADTADNLFGAMRSELAKLGFTDVLLVAAQPGKSFAFVRHSKTIDESRVQQLCEQVSNEILDKQVVSVKSPLNRWLQQRSVNVADRRGRKGVS